MQTIQISLNEYNSLKEKANILKDSQILKKVDKLLDILYQEKYGLYLGDYTNDLTETVVNDSWNDKVSKWNEI